MGLRRTMGYFALGSALWRGYRWYRNRKHPRFHSDPDVMI